MRMLWFLLPFVLASCEAEEKDHYYSIDYYTDAFHIKSSIFSTNIRFEDSNGNNRLASLSDATPGYSELDDRQKEYFQVKCIRESDKAEMTLNELSWFCPEEGYETDNIFGSGPQISFNWRDMDVYSGRNPNYMSGNSPLTTYDESYTITIQSNRILGEGVTHTIRWTIHVEDEHYTATRCQLDGQDINPWESPEYIYMTGCYPQDEFHFVKGVIHIVC